MAGRIITNNLETVFRALRSGEPLPEMPEPHVTFPDIGAYASPVMASTGSGLVKSAASGIIYTQPQFFSPIHTPINWQIPSKRKELYQWARYYWENEPKVATAIEFLARFPVNGFVHECKNRYVKRFYDKFTKDIHLLRWLRIISHEVHLLGDCFPFLEIECRKCGGRGYIGDQLCSHEGGSFKRLVILNPEYVEVYSTPLVPDPVIAFIPNDELRNLVMRRGPGHEKLTEELRKLIGAGKPISLDNRCVSHIKYMDNGYNRYGVGIVRRLFPILAYKTKLMTAQWIVAERLILPIKIVKVGSEERPASPQDLANVQAQLAQTANDPNLTLVTHHAFELDWFGASGKILQVTGEFELINQEILDGLGINKALLNGEGPCYHPDVEILTEEGWKHYYEVADGERLGTFNPKTGAMEFQNFKNRIIRGYDGDLVRFKTNKVEMLTTTNHRMWLQERISKDGEEAYSEWKVVPAEEVKYRSRMRACVDGWDGVVPECYLGEDGKFQIQVGKTTVTDLDAFMAFVGYYVSEGCSNIKQAGISQKTKSAVTKKILDYLTRTGLFFNVIPEKLPEGQTNSDGSRADPEGMTLFNFRKDTALWLMENIPGHARIPKWIRNLPKPQLAILLETLLDGDGCLHKHSSKDSPYNSYITSSKLLADDVLEISLKLGYASWISYCREEEEMYLVQIPSSNIGKFPVMDTLTFGSSSQDRRKCISREHYAGTVWCFEVPNEFLIVRMHGKPLICGNTYSNAAIGVEVMIDKLESWRQDLTEWVEQKIYLPLAIMRGFTQKNEWGEEEWVYPRMKWNIMHLRDQQQYRQFMLQLHEKQAISTQRLLESFDINYDEEVELLRYERAQGAIGAPQPGAGGPGMGGGFTGMPPMPELGGIGGGMPELGGPPGGMPGGAPGGAPGAARGGMPGGAPAPTAGAKLSSTTANIQDFGGKVLKEKTRTKLEKQRQQMFERHSGPSRDEKGRVMFTGPERQIMKEIVASARRGDIKQRIFPQYPVKFGSEEYTIDFAMPDIKLGIEVDGELFHSTDEQVASDRQRDSKLSSLGWTVVRFTDREVDSEMRQVMETVLKYVTQKEELLRKSFRPEQAQ